MPRFLICGNPARNITWAGIGAATLLNSGAMLQHLPLQPAQHGLSLSRCSWEGFSAHVLQGQLVLPERARCVGKWQIYCASPAICAAHVQGSQLSRSVWVTVPAPHHTHGNRTVQEIPNENVSPMVILTLWIFTALKICGWCIVINPYWLNPYS